jgi:ATP-dependent protease Clp ATPase subunit
MTEATAQCSFCGKSPDEVPKLAVGLNARICNVCLDLCNDITLAEFRDPSTAGRNPSFVCSFCGKDHRRWVIAGPKVYICDECVDGFRAS